MKPKEFVEANTVFAKDQPEYQALPAFRNKSLQGEVVTCWSLTLKERLKVLFFGEIWLALVTFNRPLQASFMSTKKSDLLVTVKVTL